MSQRVQIKTRSNHLETYCLEKCPDKEEEVKKGCGAKCETKKRKTNRYIGRLESVEKVKSFGII